MLSTAGASLKELTFRHIMGATYHPDQTSEADDKEKEPYRPLRLYDERVRSLTLNPSEEELAYLARFLQKD